MKKAVVAFAIGVAVCLPIAGCKKSEDSKTAIKTGSADTVPKTDDRVELKLKWPVGNRYVQRMDIVQCSEINVPQAPQPVKQEVTMGQDYSLTVTQKRPGGGHVLELEFLSTEMDVTMGGKSVMTFDSKGEAGDETRNPLAAMFRKMAGARIMYLMDVSNQVERVEGFEEFREKVTKDSPPQARDMLTGIYSEDYLKQMVGYSRNLPANAVKPGETWPVQTEIAMGPMGSVVSEATYTFKGWELHGKQRCALLEFTGTLKSKEGLAPGKPGMNMTIENGVSSGKTWFDPELGMFRESAIDQDLNMRITFQASPDPANPALQGQTMTSTMSQQIKIILSEVSQGSK